MSEAIAPADGGQGAAPASSSAALAAAPAAPAAPTSQQAATPAPAAPVAPATWLNGLDEVTTGYAQNKGWDNPAKAIDSYRNLEKLLGADRAGNTVILPKADADAKEWGALYDRMGRPADAKGYNVPMPEGGDPKVHEMSMAKFHELGLTKAQGEQLATWYNGITAEAMGAQAAQKAQDFQVQDQALKSEWGAAYTQNLAQAQQGVRALGLDAATIDKLSDALGHKATMAMLQKIGSGLKEDALISGDNLQSFSGALSPGQAKAEIQTLMSDKNFVARYMGKDKDAMAKMDALHKFAFPEG
jgi:hypothetical protein